MIRNVLVAVMLLTAGFSVGFVASSGGGTADVDTAPQPDPTETDTESGALSYQAQVYKNLSKNRMKTMESYREKMGVLIDQQRRAMRIARETGSVDPDGDSYVTMWELMKGTDPVDPDSHPSTRNMTLPEGGA